MPLPFLKFFVSVDEKNGCRTSNNQIALNIYEARAAQLCADSVLVSSRRGIDADEPAAAARLEAIRDCLRRGLSPEQMAARNGGPVDLSPSTICLCQARAFN